MRGHAIGTHHESFGELARRSARSVAQLLELSACIGAFAEQRIHLAPVARKAIEQLVVTREARVRLGCVDRRHELRPQIADEIVHFARRHHRAQRALLGEQHAVTRRVEAELAVGHAGLRGLRHELPEARAA